MEWNGIVWGMRRLAEEKIARLAETIEHSPWQARVFAALRGFVAACLLLCLLPAAAAADAFIVRGVAISGEGGDAEQARQAAVLSGRVEAFRRLAQRLVADEDLPSVPALGAAEVEPLVVSTEVEQESIKKTSYSARLTYRFDAEKVRQLFAGQGLRFTEAESRPLVVLPVLGEGEAARLWADPNPWRLAWANHWNPAGLVPLLVPLGELQDLAAADAPEALAGDEAALAELAALYGAGGALVTQASLGGDPAAGSGQLSIRGRFYGGASLEPFAFQVAQQAGEEEAAFWQRAVAAVDARVQSDWKRLNAIYYGTQSSLPVTVAIGALQDWLLTRRILDEEPLVIAVKVLSLSQQSASIVVTHRGTVEQLQRALAQQDLTLSQGVEGWDLRIGSGVTRLNPTPLGAE